MEYCSLKDMMADLQGILDRVGEDARVAIYCHCCDNLDTYKGATGEGPTKSPLTGEIMSPLATVVIGVNR